MDPALVSLLALTLLILSWRAVTRDRREYGRFKRMRTTRARQRMYRKWLVESLVVFSVLSAAVLLAVWQLVPAVLADARAAGPVAAVVDWFATPLGRGAAIGAGVAFLALLVLPVLFFRGRLDEIPKVGDIGALIPRTRAEVGYGAGLSVVAGVFEELLFRLAIPALLFGITGDGVLAFLAAALFFGALHIYQGLPGVLASTALGLVLAAIYVLTGSIWVVIAIHTLIDVRTLVLIPLAVLGVGRAHPPRATRSRPPARDTAQ